MTESIFKAIVGRYEIGDPISAGGIAEVHQAKHMDEGRTYAIKIMRREKMTEERHVRAFNQEYELLRSLDHKAIPKAYLTGLVRGRPYMIIDYYHGMPLHQLVKKQATINVESTLLRITEAVGYLHAQGVVHNDLKLENIILMANGEIGLVDFGNARRIQKRSLWSLIFPAKKEPLFGTPTYFAPEMILGDPSTTASDLYAIGVCCFFLLTGEPPFVYNRKSARLHAAVNEQPPSIGERAAGLTPQFIKLIDSCLQKDPAKRPIDAEFLAAGLRSAIKAGSGTGIYSRKPKTEQLKIQDIEPITAKVEKKG
jgi:serine/threonine-protein kinase